MKRDRKGRFIRPKCDLCRRPTRYIGYNRIIKSRDSEGRIENYVDFQCGVFCKAHGKEWLARRREQHSYTHRLTWV